ncbi:MAG: hypothetical protein K8Q89_10320 [Nitrosarchaeum sp.]|nr:hypothetical protein [Nitrosarchaeum sp.]
MKYFAFFLSLVLVVSLTPSVIAPPDFSDQEKYNAAHVIVTGKIVSFSKPDPLSYQLSSTDTIYEVKVDKYIKNPLGKQVLSVIARGGPDAEDDPMGSTVTFDVGDNVYLYLREDGDMYRVNTVTSYRISTPCEPIPEELAHLTDMPSPWEFQTVDSNYNKKQIFAVGEKIIIQVDVTNTQSDTRTITYDIVIHDGKKKDERAIYYTDSKDITLPACIGHTVLEWSFIPTEAHDYFVDVRSDGSGRGFGISVTADGSAPSNYDDIPIKTKPILKQFKENTPEGELQCSKQGTTLAFKIDGSPACITPDTLAKLLQRGWVAEKRYIPLPDMNISEKPNYSEITSDAAIKFLESGKTFTFDGTERNGGFANLAHKDGLPPTYLISGRFSTDTTGYGDRINQESHQIKTDHNIVMKVKGTEVVYAVIDNQWDEINQKFIAKRSEDFKDFEVHYQKFFGQERRDEQINLESRPGLMRITGTDDVHYLVNHSEFEKFWQIVIENEFFDIQQTANNCETCISYVLNIESGGTHNTIHWIEGDTLDTRLFNVLSALEEITKNQDDGWPT